MKKTICLLSTIFGLIFLSNFPAFADSPLLSSQGPYTVGGFGDKTEKNLFSPDEKPFSFVEFDPHNLNPGQNLQIDWFWQFGDTKIFHDTRTINAPNLFSPGPLRLWDSLNNWDSIKKSGDWHVVTQWFNPDNGTGRGGSGTQAFTFTVTPEPVSTLLFLVGAAPIALRLSRKTKLT